MNESIFWLPELKYSWFSLLQELQVDIRSGEVVFIDLFNAYSNPQRHYHNWEHIRHIFNLLEEVKDISECFTTLQFCTWFHDYIYNPQAKDNELQSALYAEKTLNKLNIDLTTIQTIKQIILSTQKHLPLTESIDNLIFLDVDLAILGTSPDKYWQYAHAIRKEYSYLCDRDYQRGRKQVLIEFLNRAKIYYTDYFYQKFELTARKNIQAEIKALHCSSNI